MVWRGARRGSLLVEDNSGLERDCGANHCIIYIYRRRRVGAVGQCLRRGKSQRIERLADDGNRSRPPGFVSSHGFACRAQPAVISAGRGITIVAARRARAAKKILSGRRDPSSPPGQYEGPEASAGQDEGPEL
jgi:hypothetical protein